MPMPDKMGLEFTPAEITDLNTFFDGILNIMNSKKVVQLTAKERQAAQSASEKRLPYIQNAITTLAPDFPNLQPNFLKFSDAVTDLNSSVQLRALASKRNEVNDRMIDFSMASEHFAYEYMRELYEVAKRAQKKNTPGADTVVNALAPLFEDQGGQPETVPTP